MEIEFAQDDLLMECVAPFELNDAIAPLVDNRCEIYLSYCPGLGYSIYAKGNIPEF